MIFEPAPTPTFRNLELNNNENEEYDYLDHLKINIIPNGKITLIISGDNIVLKNMYIIMIIYMRNHFLKK